MGSFHSQASVLTFSLRRFVDLTKYTASNPDYSFKLTPLNDFNLTYGNWLVSAIGFKMRMERYSTKYILNYYLPSLIFVTASWASFLIPPTIVPGRMALLITLLLVLINFYGTIIQNQPPSQKPTALVMWTLVCGMFVFGALLAYSVLLYKLFKTKGPKDCNQRRHQTKQEFEKLIEQNLANSDKLFLIIFPSLFAIFNLIYWPLVLHQKPFDHQPSDIQF